MIKILHVINSPNFGGIEKLVFDLLNIQKINPELKVALFITLPKGEMINDFINTGVECFLGKLKSGYDVNPFKIKKNYGIFKEYDILHFHSFNPFLSLIALISRKKIIYSEHGNFGFGRKLKIEDRVKYLLLNVFLNHFVSFISFNSNFIRSISEKKYGLEKIPREVIYNGINFKEDKEESENIDEIVASKINQKFVIGTTSRFAGFKRIDRLIEAFSFFQTQKDTFLLLVGDGILRTELESQVEKYGISKKVVFTGYKKNVHAYQKAMDVCVFPSQNEPFGLVAVEALSLGKPVIVFKDGGGIVEIVGSRFPEDVVENVHGLVERMNYFYKLGNADAENVSTRITYSKKYDIAQMEQKVFNIYKGIMGCAE